MIKWVLTAILITLILARTPLAKKIRLGDLPGDVRIASKRYTWAKLHLPFTSTVLIGVALFCVSRLLK